MALLEVLKYPHPKLRHRADPVERVDGELLKLSEDMLETMYNLDGIGLAATQVGYNCRLLVIDITPQNENSRYDLYQSLSEAEKKVKMPLVIFNPEILKKEGKTSFQEGCLSLPGYFEVVDRHKFIQVKGLDKEGKPVEYELDGLISICIQHEIDHLDGKVFIDRLSSVKSHFIKSKIKKYGYQSNKKRA